MKSRYWSLAIVLILVNYLIFAALFSKLIETDFGATRPTRTPVPTFTPAPAQPMIVVPTPTPVTPVPSPTPTLVVEDGHAVNPGGDVTASSNGPAQPDPATQPQLVAPGAVNIRSGPGLDYEVIGTLNPNTIMPIIGRNADASWWQIEIANGTTGWVSGSVVNASNTGNVPVAEISVLPALSSVL